MLLPSSTTPPAIAGAAQVGATLTTSKGRWTNSPTRYAYAWQDCVAAGGRCAWIVGATSPRYTLQASDAGYAVRARVSAANASGGAAAWSLATGVVTGH